MLPPVKIPPDFCCSPLVACARFPPACQVEVSLVVRAGHVLAFDPPLEELRLQHLTVHVQPFLALPMRMKGVSGLSERAGFFGAVARAHPCAVAKVFEACEALLAALADSEAHRYCSGWLAALELGTGDAASLEAALEEALWRGCGERNAGTGTGTGAVTADDSDAAGIAAWELNMRALQSAARDLQTLPDEVRSGGCVIRQRWLCDLRRRGGKGAHTCHAQSSKHWRPTHA